FFQAEDGIRDDLVTGVQTCALPIYKALNANNLINIQQGRPKSPYHFNQFGGYVGGPLRKDRDFVFFNYDGQRNTLPNLVFLNLRSEERRVGKECGTLRGSESGR